MERGAAEVAPEVLLLPVLLLHPVLQHQGLYHLEEDHHDKYLLLIISEVFFIEAELPPLVELPPVQVEVPPVQAPVQVEVSPVEGVAEADVGEYAVVGGK